MTSKVRWSSWGGSGWGGAPGPPKSAAGSGQGEGVPRSSSRGRCSTGGLPKKPGPPQNQEQLWEGGDKQGFRGVLEEFWWAEKGLAGSWGDFGESWRDLWGCWGALVGGEQEFVVPVLGMSRVLGFRGLGVPIFGVSRNFEGISQEFGGSGMGSAGI